MRLWILLEIKSRYLFYLLSLATAFSATSPDYIAQYKPIADALSEKYNIPSAVILAVAILESDSGRSRVVLNLRNHFGIMGKSNRKWRSRFKQYNSVEESFIDFCERITKFDFYLKLDCETDYKIWIDKISKTGYSSQPKKWKAKVLKTILINDLKPKE